MQTDQLGMLSNIHLQLADQHDSGTLHPDCIKLAQMASTSVDFSKTGVPVNMSECPKYPRLRPDFMAPSPRAVISQQGHVDFEEDIQEDAALDDLDVDVRPMRFYTSDNILGFLYRAIDEKQFLQQIHNDHELLLSSSASASNSSLMKELLTYVKHAASGFFYHQYKAHAEEIKAG